MMHDFDRIRRGMSAEQVKAILGPPDEVHRTGFGNEKMTTWTYHAGGDDLFVWFDENDSVKLKSRK